jgi:predicted MPP superfamily phosphohydrolase
LFTKKFLIGLALTLGFFALLNCAILEAFSRLYPGHFRLFTAAAVPGNLLWLFLPLVFRRKQTFLLRLVRSLLIPPWVAWNAILLFYGIFFILMTAAGLLINIFYAVPFRTLAVHASNGAWLFLAFILLVGFFQNLVPIHLEKIRIPIPGLPPEFQGFKIAMVSDLHVGLFTRPGRLRRFSEIIQKEDPALLVVGGDITDDDPGLLPKYLKSLDPISPSIPVVGILGNHEIYSGPQKSLELLRESRVKMLVNEGMEIKRGGSSVWLAGIGDFAARDFPDGGGLAPDFEKALAGKPDRSPVILLSHQPKGFPEAVRRKVALTLSGHTHGGQLGLRSLNWSLARPFVKYHMGCFREGESRLYVSTGTGYWGLPVRFGLPPEITLITLESE